jgi:hypothetical protein
MSATTTVDPHVAALPTFAQAAELVGVDPSGISRAAKRLGIEPIRWGNREKHLSVADLLTIALKAHRHPLEGVAGELLDRVERDHPEQSAAIRAEIDEFFAALPKPVATPEAQFIAELRAVAPPEDAERLIALYQSARRSHQ